MNHHYYYACDAAQLLETCIDHLQTVVDLEEGTNSNNNKSKSDASTTTTTTTTSNRGPFYELQRTLLQTERLLRHFFVQILPSSSIMSEQQQQQENGMGQKTRTNPMANNETSLSSASTRLPSLSCCVTALRTIMEQEQEQEQRRRRRDQSRRQPQHNNGNATMSTHPPISRNLSGTTTPMQRTSKSATDTLLFRLIVALQLLLVRIDDAHLVVAGIRRPKTSHNDPNVFRRRQTRRKWLVRMGFCTTVVGLTYYLLPPVAGNNKNDNNDKASASSSFSIILYQHNSLFSREALLPTLAKAGVSTVLLFQLAQQWKVAWMASKLGKSTTDILEWQQQWRLVEGSYGSQQQLQHLLGASSSSSSSNLKATAAAPQAATCTATSANGSNATDAAKARRLIEYAQQRQQQQQQQYNTPSSSRTLQMRNQRAFWDEGELRFLIVRKAMETYYSWTTTDHHQAASSNHGNNNNNNNRDDADDEQSNLYQPQQNEQQQLTSSSSFDARAMMLSNSWGLVSQPGVKNFSLRASRFLKGASVADRIDIAGVPCFVVSKYPCPELAAAIQQTQTKRRRRLPRRMSAQLSTIQEDNDHDHDDDDHSDGHSATAHSHHHKLFAGTTSSSCRQQDIILHCTGGGFLAHMIAFDLVYLLDWSAATGAVVICPEFSLLPSHPFPVALQEVTKVYSALVGTSSGSGNSSSCGGQATMAALGIEVRRVAVTGESTGANLAAALCVNLCLGETGAGAGTGTGGSHSNHENRTNHRQPQQQQQAQAKKPSSNGQQQQQQQQQNHAHHLASDRESSEDNTNNNIRLPDALMLSCAVLNMSLELSHSRVMGTEDPVLPSGVLSAISDAYLPPYIGIRKTHILASPLFAPNSILARFPPTLLFASSNDPLLDDSVEFNQRLRSLNVSSEIRAVPNMPHAFWGLGMAGFPEAKKVHKEAQEWLATKLTTTTTTRT